MCLGFPVAGAAHLAWRRLNTALLMGPISMLLRAYPSAFGSSAPPSPEENDTGLREQRASFVASNNNNQSASEKGGW